MYKTVFQLCIHGCVISGSFWLIIPYCVLLTFTSSVDCGPPPQIVNGTVFSGGIFTSVGRTARYRCNFGTNLVGNSTITCQDDGTWEDPPMCVLPGECMNYTCISYASYLHHTPPFHVTTKYTKWHTLQLDSYIMQVRKYSDWQAETDKIYYSLFWLSWMHSIHAMISCMWYST